MLDENDVRVLERMFEGLRCEMHQEFGKVREEMIQGFDDVQREFVKVRAEMTQGFKTVRDDIIDVIDQNIQPQLTSSTARIVRLERRIA